MTYGSCFMGPKLTLFVLEEKDCEVKRILLSLFIFLAFD